MSRSRFTRSVACEALESRVFLAADAIIQWNNLALQAIKAEQDHVGPGWASRDLAMTQAAIFDAVNAIDGGYQSYLYQGTAPKDASVEAAIAAAADQVLTAVFPTEAGVFQDAYNAALAAIPDGTSKDEGVATGQAAATTILNARANDHSADQTSYTFGTNPGDYQATPPDYPAAWGPGWGNVSTFGIQSASDYLPPPPPALDSPEYAQALNEVKRLGAANSTSRTAEQTQIAKFWSYDSQSYGTPLVMYNQILQNVAQSQGNTLQQDARLFALANIAMADAGVVTWDAKYTYNLWRPITAIQQAGTDGNPATQADPNWQPLGYDAGSYTNRTPAFPSYTSGHSAFGAALFRTLAGFYGTDNVSFDATSDNLPGVTRHFTSFSQAAQENGISRIYLGVHFSFDNTQALIAGANVGAYDVGHLLLPSGSSGDETNVSFPVTSPGNSSGQDAGHGNGHSSQPTIASNTFSNQPLINPATTPIAA